MNANARSRLQAVLLAALLAAPLMPGAALAQRVGVNSGVNPEAQGALPGANLRRLVIGQDVVYRERIVTEQSGQTAVLFVDESTMTVGPNSDMVIDRFVYDPRTGTGELAGSLTRGVFRYVGGKLSKHDQAVTMKTPAATIGIRGGIVLLNVMADGQTEAIFVFGQGMTVTGLNGIVQTVTRSGFEVMVARPGATPSAPVPAPQRQTLALLALLDGQTGKSGGATTIPTDTTVAASGINVAGNFNQSQLAALQHQPLSGQAPQFNVGAAQQQFQIQTASSLSQPILSGQNAGPTSAGTPLSGGFASTGGAGAAQGFTAPVTPYAAFSASTPNGGHLTSSGFSAQSVPVAFPLAGCPSGGVTACLGDFNATGTTSPLGPVTGTSLTMPGNTFFFADLTPTGAPGQAEFVYGGQQVAQSFYQPTGAPRFLAFNVAPDAALNSPVPFIRQGSGGNVPNPNSPVLLMAAPANSSFAGGSAALTKSLQASLAIEGETTAQRSVLVVSVGNVFTSGNAQPVLDGTINGTFRGSATNLPTRVSSSMVTPTDGNGATFYGGSSISGFVLNNQNAAEVSFPGGQTTNYGFAQPAFATSLPRGVGASQTTQTLTGFFGGTMQPVSNGVAGSPYAIGGQTTVSTDASLLQVAANFSGSDPFTASTSGIHSMTLAFGSLQPGVTRGRQGYIDDNLYAALESPVTPSTIDGSPLLINGDPLQASHIYVVTSDAVGTTAQLCQCAFLHWGYWGGEVDTPTTNGNGIARSDVGHINTWIAGQPTPVGDLATLASQNFQGTYNGHLMGSVFNNGAHYMASGGLTATFNFGTQTGNFAVSNYDGRSFSEPIPRSGNLNGAGYQFQFAGGGIAGKVQGSFFGHLAAETGGNFAFQATTGPTYFTSGIFAAKR